MFEAFLEKARLIHGDRYTYGLFSERDEKSRTKIICDVHGPFWQTRQNHLKGSGCKPCALEFRTTTVEEFIERSQQIHGIGTFDYSRVIQFKSTREKVLIICPNHGEFYQQARDHMRGVSCQNCAIERSRTNFEEFVARARLIHGDRYHYFKETWGLIPGFVELTCSEHGRFKQNWYNHTIGMGCARCVSQVSRAETRLFEWINESVEESVIQSNRKVIYPKELDIYIPSLALAVEFNGIAYHDKLLWSQSVLNEGIVSRESEKSQICKSIGIRLIHIWEDDYLSDEELWSNSVIDAVVLARSENLSALDSLIRNLSEDASKSIPRVTGQLSNWKG